MTQYANAYRNAHSIQSADRKRNVGANTRATAPLRRSKLEAADQTPHSISYAGSVRVEQRWKYVQFFVALQSQQGFMNDLRREKKTHNPQTITCPTLIIHSRFKGSVPLVHGRHNARRMPAVKLPVIDAEIHLVRIGDA